MSKDEITDDEITALMQAALAARDAAAQAAQAADEAVQAADQAKLKEWQTRLVYVLACFEEYDQDLQHSSEEECREQFQQRLADIDIHGCCKECMLQCLGPHPTALKRIECGIKCSEQCGSICI